MTPISNTRAISKESEMAEENGPIEMPEIDELEERLKALENAERAVDSAYATGKAERSKITQMAQLDAADAVAMAGIAMESDVDADEAMRIRVIAEKSNDREKTKLARQRERAARKKANADHKAASKSARKAYDSIRFSAPNRMGFMRAVQVIFAIHIGFVLVWLMLTSRDAMTYNVSTMMDWIMVILEGVAFWMFINRYKIGRPFVIIMAAIGIIVPAAFDIATGRFNLFAIAWNDIFYIFLILYFAFSKRVKATLVNELGKEKGDYEKEDFVVNRQGWPFIRNLIIYFIVFSIVGHWMEMGMCQFIILGVVQGEYDLSNTMLWRDWLYPFPMEGAAVVVIGLVLYPFFLWLKSKFTGKKRILAYVLSFLAGALLCSVIEFGMGMFVNADYQLWDYRENFGNLMGQVCLQNTLAFGVVAAIITWWVYPLLERLIARVPRDIMNIAFVVIAVFGAIIWSLYLIDPPDVNNGNSAGNKTDSAIVQNEGARTVAAYLASVNDSVNDLEKAINATSGVEKEKLEASVKKIRAELKVMLTESLGFEEFPDIYEAFFVKTIGATGSNIGNSTGSSTGSSAETS